MRTHLSTSIVPTHMSNTSLGKGVVLSERCIAVTQQHRRNTISTKKYCKMESVMNMADMNMADIQNRSILATESTDTDVFTFLDIALNDVDRSQRSSQSRHSSLDNSSGRAPPSILKKVPSYSSFSNMGSLSNMGSMSVSNLSNLSNMGNSSPKSSKSAKSAHQICVEEPELDTFVAPKMKRVASIVSFQSVDVREYDRTLGDNPSCMSGPPISLDWSYSETTAVCINEYEDKRTPKRILRMSKVKRENMLKSKLGYSEEEIETAKKEKKKLQRNRSVTDLIAPFWRIEHAIQSVKRKLDRRSNKKKTGDDLSSSTRSVLSTSSVDRSAGTMQTNVTV